MQLCGRDVSSIALRSVCQNLGTISAFAELNLNMEKLLSFLREKSRTYEYFRNMRLGDSSRGNSL